MRQAIADLVLAAAGLTIAAAFICALIRRLFDHAEAWDRTTLDDIYSHPRVGPAASERPGPGQP